MYWATSARPVPLEKSGWVNTMYLASGSAACDPMTVWGTTVETGPLDAFLAERRQNTGIILSTAHVLLRAVAKSLQEHPQVNRRVVGRRAYQYNGVNILMPMLQTRAGEVGTVFLHAAEKMSLADIARRFWTEARERSQRAVDDERRRREGTRAQKTWVAIKRHLRLHWIHRMSWLGFALGNHLRIPTIWSFQQELNGAHAFVNYLGFPGAPPMIAFKPSCLPMNAYSVSVTMGPSELRPVVVDNAVVIRSQAPLFVRADHRMVNAYAAAAFIATLRAYLANPKALDDEDQKGIRQAA